MKLTNDEVYILTRLMEEDPDLSYFYRHFEDENHKLPELKKAMKHLRELGLVEHNKGLFDDDGMTAGSGHQIIYSERKRVEELLGI